MNYTEAMIPTQLNMNKLADTASSDVYCFPVINYALFSVESSESMIRYDK